MQVSIHNAGAKFQSVVGSILSCTVLSCNQEGASSNKSLNEVSHFQGSCLCYLVAGHDQWLMGNSLQMAIAAVVHVFVYPATPYVLEFNIMGIVAKTMAEEDREGTVARVKESFHDVVFGGGERVSSLHINFFRNLCRL